jgi:glutamate---cysteine ligase / carboxylate-amine ligase
MSGFRFGIEEEYFIVDRRTGGIICELPQAFMTAAWRRLGDHLMNEILQSQIEVATSPARRAAEAREELLTFRSALAEVGRRLGIGLIAAGTHPLALPQQQRPTRKARYEKAIDDLGMVGLGNALCALHVHVEVPEPDRRVEIMDRLVPYLPLLLALSTSSPFWSGYDTGLLGYRNACNDAFPRSGLPERFGNTHEYEAFVEALVRAEIIPDASHVWWCVRPSVNHPTLELRLTDCCTSVDDALAIASPFRALVRHFFHDGERHARLSAVSRALCEENRWRAQRYGIDGTYLDVRTREIKPFAALLEDTLVLVAPDIAELGINHEIAHLRTILQRGTSAHKQLELYRQRLNDGLTPRQALGCVARWLRASTEAGDFVSTHAHLRAEKAAWAAGDVDSRPKSLWRVEPAME